MFLCTSRLPSFPPGDPPSRASKNQITAGIHKDSDTTERNTHKWPTWDGKKDKFDAWDYEMDGLLAVHGLLSTKQGSNRKKLESADEKTVQRYTLRNLKLWA